MKNLLSLILFSFLILLTTQTCHSKELVLNVSQIRPDVMKEGNGYIGFGIDIVNEIAQINGYNYVIIDSSFEELLDNIKNNKVDLAVAGISLTSTREKDMDFSYGYLDDGIGILTSGRQKTYFESWIEIFWRIRWAITLTLICIILIYFAEKRDQDKPDAINTIEDSAWWVWSMGTTVGPGDKTPKTKIGRWLSIILSFVLISVVLPVYLEEFTSNRSESIVSDINNLQDLQLVKVSTVYGTTNQDEITRIVKPENLFLTTNIESSYKLLVDKQVDAVVYDYSSLKYDFNEKNMSKTGLILIDKIFKSVPYAIAIPKNNKEIYKEIKVALRKIQENGTYDRIHFKWFGK